MADFDHKLTAWEPVMQKTGWVVEDGELAQLYKIDKDHIDLPGRASRYECSCGKEFAEWADAADHLRECGS